MDKQNTLNQSSFFSNFSVEKQKKLDSPVKRILDTPNIIAEKISSEIIDISPKAETKSKKSNKENNQPINTPTLSVSKKIESNSTTIPSLNSKQTKQSSSLEVMQLSSASAPKLPESSSNYNKINSLKNTDPMYLESYNENYNAFKDPSVYYPRINSNDKIQKINANDVSIPLTDGNQTQESSPPIVPQNKSTISGADILHEQNHTMPSWRLKFG